MYLSYKACNLVLTFYKKKIFRDFDRSYRQMYEKSKTQLGAFSPDTTLKFYKKNVLPSISYPSLLFIDFKEIKFDGNYLTLDSGFFP